MKKSTNKLLSKIIKDQFFQASFWIFLGIGFMNVGNYLYHLLMGRMLGASLYGALESIISALYIISVPTLTMNLVVVKYVSAHKGRGEHSLINDLYSYILRELILYGSIVLILLLFLSPLIESFLHLPSIELALLLPISFFFSLFYFLNKSILQGISSFLKLSVLNLIESVVKVAFSVALVAIGLKTLGAYVSVVLSVIVGLLVSVYYIRKIIKIKLSKASYLHRRELLKFSLPTFVTSLALISLFTTDVILARHFLSSVDSGYYSALSVLGKIVYFAASPIVLVLFPMISEQHAKGESYKRLLFLGAGITLFISVGITVLFFLFPNIMVLALFGEKYLKIAGLLGVFGIFISLLSLCNLFANFYLSIHKTFPSYIVAFASLLQIILITLFHSDILEMTLVSTIVTFLLLIFLLLYYPRAKNS